MSKEITFESSNHQHLHIAEYCKYIYPFLLTLNKVHIQSSMQIGTQRVIRTKYPEDVRIVPLWIENWGGRKANKGVTAALAFSTLSREVLGARVYCLDFYKDPTQVHCWLAVRYPKSGIGSALESMGSCLLQDISNLLNHQGKSAVFQQIIQDYNAEYARNLQDTGGVSLQESEHERQRWHRLFPYLRRTIVPNLNSATFRFDAPHVDSLETCSSAHPFWTRDEVHRSLADHQRSLEPFVEASLVSADLR